MTLTNYNPLQAIRGDADELFSLFSLPVNKVVRHSAQYIRPFLVEVLLGLKYGPADQRVESTFDLGNTALEIEVMKLGAKFFD